MNTAASIAYQECRICHNTVDPSRPHYCLRPTAPIGTYPSPITTWERPHLEEKKPQDFLAQSARLALEFENAMYLVRSYREELEAKDRKIIELESKVAAFEQRDAEYRQWLEEREG